MRDFRHRRTAGVFQGGNVVTGREGERPMRVSFLWLL